MAEEVVLQRKSKNVQNFRESIPGLLASVPKQRIFKKGKKEHA